MHFSSKFSAMPDRDGTCTFQKINEQCGCSFRQIGRQFNVEDNVSETGPGILPDVGETSHKPGMKAIAMEKDAPMAAGALHSRTTPSRLVRQISSHFWKAWQGLRTRSFAASCLS